MTCKHEDFQADVKVHRLTNGHDGHVDGYMADVQIHRQRRPGTPSTESRYGHLRAVQRDSWHWQPTSAPPRPNPEIERAVRERRRREREARTIAREEYRRQLAAEREAARQQRSKPRERSGQQQSKNAYIRRVTERLRAKRQPPAPIPPLCPMVLACQQCGRTFGTEHARRVHSNMMHGRSSAPVADSRRASA